MIRKSVLILSLFWCFCPAMAGVWIEDSLGISFEFPRGWGKGVLRGEESARIQFFKANREAVIQIDALKRGKEYDLDRFIEETIDQFLQKYPDLKVVREKKVEEDVPGFEDSTFVVLHYHEQSSLVSNRFLFHKKGNVYFVIQAKTPRKKFGFYSKDFDLVMKSFRLEPRPRLRWRNDSLAYLDSKENESLVQYIGITIRPIDSYPTEAKQTETEWLDAAEPFVIKEETPNEPVTTGKPTTIEQDKRPVVPPDDNPL